MLAGAREVGDLGLTAEQLLGELEPDRPASLEVAEVFEGLHEIAEAQGTGSQGRKLTGLVDLLARATPLEARYLVRTVTGSLRLGIGTATILDALAEVHAGGRKQRLILERAYNICSDLGLVAATLVDGGLAARGGDAGAGGQPGAADAGPAAVEPAEILAKLGGSCAAEYKYDGIRVQAHRTADGVLELYTRRLDRVSTQFPELVEAARREHRAARGDPGGRGRGLRPGLGGAAAVPGRDVPPPQVRHHRGGQGLPREPVLLRAAVRRRHRPHPAAVPGTAGAAGRGHHAVAAAAAGHRHQVSDEAALEAVFEQPVAEGCEGLICKSVAPEAHYQAGARGWQWIKLKRDYRTELSDTLDLVVVGGLAGRGRRAGMYGALLLAVYDPAGERFQTICKCGTGFSDAELAALPARLAPLARAQRPASVDSRWAADVWFEPTLVVEVLAAELTLSPHHTAGWGLLKEDAGLALRFPRFTGRWRDDKSPTDATTVTEAVAMFRTARRAPA